MTTFCEDETAARQYQMLLSLLLDRVNYVYKCPYSKASSVFMQNSVSKKLKKTSFFKNKNEANCYMEELRLVPQLNPIFLLLLNWRMTNAFMKAEGSMIEGLFPAASLSLLFIPVILLSFPINRAQHKKAPQN